ncbi:ComEC/Rec2 family competence protein [Streptomyces sp. BH-SS-21]|uniref:ComEC/Rec2 family competence protein n=1 Tax=Streptomyces liliiviolaceus TaxID=2823109 RepID=A0A940XT52_9ACTN|nr:ComEC/Rec2 family competence protein [Streptomyces liliiviolaceus]MBQ0849098.1 ComEC/Rec2 family competence protein [Streptomyces liliiviolaceus]
MRGPDPTSRPPVHAGSASRLGAAHPRQEGPTDLRLVPPALAAWATAAVTPDAPPGWVAGVVALCVAVVGLLLLAGRDRVRGARPLRLLRSSWSRTSVAAVLLCVAAAAASGGLHGADLRRGPIPESARQYDRVTAEVEVTSDPRLTRPRIRGNHAAPTAILLDAQVRRVERPDGTVARTRTPVLLIVDARQSLGPGPESSPRAEAEAGADAGAVRERVGSPWLSLLPSTRLRVTAQAAPALGGGDRIAAVLRVRGSGPPTVVGQPSATQRFAGELRGRLRAATDGLDPDARALLPGLVVGDTSRITPELDEAFRATDLTHILALSGANFTIVLALLIGPPGRAQRIERRGLAPRLGLPLRATALCGGALTLGFVIVCRPDPSVLRAAACGSIALLAIATGRRRSLIPALATAVLVLVLYDPWLARSYGFLLSVLATGALLTLAPRWSAGLRGRGVPPRPAEALAAAAAAQAVCAPVVAVLSARVSLVAVPCNLLVEFAVAPATVLGFATLITAPWAMPVAKVLAWCASWPAGWIADIARAGAALPGAGMDWPGSWTGALLLAGAIAALVCVGRRLLRHPWLSGTCGVLLLLVTVQPPPLTRVITGWPPPDWRFAMCDVGQGDATVLAAGDGSGVVVDAGPDPILVDRCLRALGITRVPLVVLTHFHADHVAGLPGVLRGRSVGAIETTGLEEPLDQADFVRRQAAVRHIPVRRAVAGERRRTGGLDWQVLWPPPSPAPGAGPVPVPQPEEPEPEGPNDASVTLLVRSAGLTMLMLGDLEPPAQRALLRSPAGTGLKAVDVLKVAHHGSAYQDPDLIRRAAPRLALISCGADNPYGHPAPSTTAALEAGGAQVLRTDVDGAVTVGGGDDHLLITRD